MNVCADPLLSGEKIIPVGLAVVTALLSLIVVLLITSATKVSASIPEPITLCPTCMFAELETPATDSPTAAVKLIPAAAFSPAFSLTRPVKAPLCAIVSGDRAEPVVSVVSVIGVELPSTVVMVKEFAVLWLPSIFGWQQC